MKKSTSNKNSKFVKGLKRYIIVLSIFCIAFLIYVLNTLYQYEVSFADNYVENYISRLSSGAKKGKIEKVCNISNNINVNNLDKNKDNVRDSIENKIKISEISYKKDEKSNSQEPIYGIYANNEKIMDITLNVKKQNKRLGLFSYPTWEIKDCNINNERGFYYYDIELPSNYVVNVNGAKLDDSYISNSESNDEYNVMSKYVNLPSVVTYKLDNFISEPEIKIENDNGELVDYELRNHKIQIKELYNTTSDYNVAKQLLAEDVDILDVAQKWSLFLTNDLKGNRHGFDQLNKYLIKDTNLYNMAYSWATSIDITFTSKHTLKNPTFTNTKVSDFEIYGKNAFSCTVYLEKNMKIANGNDKVDVMHDKLYFVYYDDTNDGKDNPQWKLVDMKSVSEK